MSFSTTTGSGISSLNGLTGALTLVAGSNVTITPSGTTITIAASGGGGGGATTALDNLASVAINTDLIFGTGFAGSLQTATSAAASTPVLLLATGDMTSGIAGQHSGSLNILTGSSNSAGANNQSKSGTITIQSGAATGNNGSGRVILQTGNSLNNSGGIVLLSGQATGAVGISGTITIASGNASLVNSGSVLIASGGTGTGQSGNVSLVTGASSSAATGDMNLATGVAGDGSTGGMNISTGSPTANGVNSGTTNISSGTVSGTAANSGDLNLITGDSTTSGNSGSISLSVGAPISGTQGTIQFVKAGVTNSIGDVWTATSIDGKGYWAAGGGGGATIALNNLASTAINTDLIFDNTARTPTPNQGPTIISGGGNFASGDNSFIITSGNTVANIGSVYNNLKLLTPDSVGGSAHQTGDIQLSTGSISGNSNTSGSILITSGDSSGGVTGDVTVSAGTAAANHGGSARVFGGQASGGGHFAGDVTIISGPGLSGATPGDVTITSTGNIRLTDGTEGIGAGAVWTLQDGLGNGHWAAGPTLSAETALGTLTWSAGVAPSGTISKTYRSFTSGKQITVTAKVTATVAGTAVTALSFPLPAGLPAPATWTTQESGGLITPGTGSIQAAVGNAVNGNSGLYDDGAGGWTIKITDLSAVSATAAYAQVTYYSA